MKKFVLTVQLTCRQQWLGAMAASEYVLIDSNSPHINIHHHNFIPL